MIRNALSASERLSLLREAGIGHGRLRATGQGSVAATLSLTTQSLTFHLTGAITTITK